MFVFVLNCGSSSFKYQLLDMSNENRVAAGLVERIGMDDSILAYEPTGGEKIKEVAREHNVPIRENVPLARALYKAVDVGDMIPQELYKATATILASIWRMKGKTPGK